MKTADSGLSIYTELYSNCDRVRRKEIINLDRDVFIEMFIGEIMVL